MSKQRNMSNVSSVPVEEIRDALIGAYTLYVKAIQVSNDPLELIVREYIFNLIDCGRMQIKKFDEVSLCDDPSLPQNIGALELLIENSRIPVSLAQNLQPHQTPITSIQ